MTQISNARYLADGVMYDVTVTVDGKTFDYTVHPDDPADLAVAIRAAMVANPIPIAAYTPSAFPAKTLFDGAEFLSRLTDAEYAKILAAASKDVRLARWLDIFRLRGEIDVTGSTAIAAKAGLVAAGLLSQERADVIFATA